jgi:hypothetical protein
MGHLELLHRPEVYAQLHAWLDPLVARRSGSTARGDVAPVSA